MRLMVWIGSPHDATMLNFHFNMLLPDLPTFSLALLRQPTLLSM